MQGEVKMIWARRQNIRHPTLPLRLLRVLG